MNKGVILTTILVVLGSSGATAKVTYEDAIKSDQELNAANIHTTRDYGFTSTELSQQNSEANKMGKWVKLGSTINTTNAGEYTSLLASSAIGQTCLKGDKGIILSSSQECIRWNSGGWACQEYGPARMSTATGFRAECQ